MPAILPGRIDAVRSITLHTLVRPSFKQGWIYRGAGYALAQKRAFLPNQYFFVFKPD
jgi:hypothetical protein